MPDWPSNVVVEAQVREIELAAATAEIEILKESLADVELALEDRGWITLSMQAAQEFTREGRRRAAALARILALQNPLIKRGLAVRAGYIWGEGVEISAADDDVNAVIQRFLDDNVDSFSGSQARVEGETMLGTGGDIFRALPTSPLTGRVRVRIIDADEIDDIICNPEDAQEPWFYLRTYTVSDAGARYAGIINGTASQRRILYPALGFKPTARMQSIDGIPVQWDTPVQHIAVNKIGTKSRFGVGDAYAAIFWARAYKEFLEDWAKLTKSLSRFAWRLTAPKRSQAQNAAQVASAAMRDVPGPTAPAGSLAAMSGSTLEAIPKSGATIDADSGKPLAGMVAAALGIPLTMLLADPGITGARATAETLDDPTRHEMELRRSLYTTKDSELLGYVIDQAVKAPKGRLRGKVSIDEYGQEVVTLADGADRTVTIDWPSLDKVAINVIVQAIVEADSTDKVPPLVIARLLLVALGVEDIDEVLKQITDENGEFIDPKLSAGQAALDRFERGDGPGAQPPAADDPASDA